MTGFGRGLAESSAKRIIVEIKSLNSKQLDLFLRLPSNFREQEISLRSKIASHLVRGKVEAIAIVENIGSNTSVRINRDVMAAYRDDAVATCESINLPIPADLFNSLLRLPDALSQDSHTADENDVAALEKAAMDAVSALVDFRSSEGSRLESFFRDKINRISALLSEIEPYEAERIPKMRHKLEEGLDKLDIEHNPERLEQELIFYIEKLDVTEEKTRLRSHMRYFIETLDGDPGQGKKLGFIAQEMGREINTLGSKANHAEMQKTVVKMKDELEQIKEQVLNVL